MNKTLIGMVTFGNLAFTKLAIRAIRETTTVPYDLVVVVGKPGDEETAAWLREEGIPAPRHSHNVGFAASINDIYDFAWRSTQHDNVIICGNDVLPYPGAIDAMIRTAEETDYEWICASQFDARSLVARYPEARKWFVGENLVFTNFCARPWELHRDSRAPEILHGAMTDVRNLCLFKRSVFERIGYADVNFWPGGYFEDNDYHHRAELAGIKACTLAHAAYFHFWSRTIHQGGKGAEHHRQFSQNESYYRRKWGGRVNGETFRQPFNGIWDVSDSPVCPPLDCRIGDRESEGLWIDHWHRVHAPVGEGAR